jgi:hypothetical protein
VVFRRDKALYPDTLPYCSAHWRGLVRPTVLVVSAIIGAAAVIWTAIIVLIRRGRRRRLR